MIDGLRRDDGDSQWRPFAQAYWPAIVAYARRKLDIVVPIDDNVPPSLYQPLGEVLVRAIES